MNANKILLAALLTSAFAPAFAVDADAEPPRMQQHVVVTRDFGPMAVADGMPLAGPLLRMHNKTVKNAPYSAEAISERQQNLADGNQIVNKTSSMSYRDSAGRTRMELSDSKGALRTVTIHDPEGVTYLLSPTDKTATKIAFDKDVARAAAEAARARIAQLRKEGKLPAERKGDGEETVVKRVARTDGEMLARIQDGVRMHITKDFREAGPDAAQFHTQMLPVIAGAFADTKWAGKATTRELGTREFDGVKAEGKLRSYEIPAGAVGNRNPITVSDETWFSPELQVTVYAKHSDARSGDNVYRLVGLKREEPAAALFTVPSDYTVRDAMANAKRMLENKEAK